MGALAVKMTRSQTEFVLVWECATVLFALIKKVLGRRLPNYLRAIPHLAKNARRYGAPESGGLRRVLFSAACGAAQISGCAAGL